MFSSLSDALADAMMSNSLSDMTVPGVMVEVDADEAEALGAFVETALTEAEAWDANFDLYTPSVGKSVAFVLPSIEER